MTQLVTKIKSIAWFIALYVFGIIALFLFHWLASKIIYKMVDLFTYLFS